MADNGFTVLGMDQRTGSIRGSGVTTTTTTLTNSLDEIIKVTKVDSDVKLVELDGGNGNDHLYGARNVENDIDGGGGNDWIEGGTQHDELHGGEGNDVIYAGDGDDDLYGDGGNDFLSGGNGDDTIDGGSGNDVIYGGSGNDTMTGGIGKDAFGYRVGNELTSVDFGALWGNDTITDFKQGEDQIWLDEFFRRLSDKDVDKIGKAVNDAVTSKTDSHGNTSTTLKGQVDLEDIDLAYGSQKQKVGNGDDILYTLNGLDGNVYEVTVKTVMNTLTGQVNLTLKFQSFDARGTKIGNAGSITFNNAADLDFSSFVRENQKLIHGHDDAAHGDLIDLSTDYDYVDALNGKGGVVYGFDGDDNIVGSVKNDVLIGGAGSDKIDGRAGNDILRGDKGIDHLYGGEGNDDIRGGDDADWIYGDGDLRSGDKQVESSKDGNDVLFGDAGNDNIFGGGGNDVISGGTGTNQLWGGSGKDIFLINGSGITFGTNGPVYMLEGGVNHLNDFKIGEDKIQLGTMFRDYAGLNSSAQKDAIENFIKTHVQHEVNSSELIIYTAKYGDTSNEVVVHLASAEEANKMLGDLATNHYDNYFVFG